MTNFGRIFAYLALVCMQSDSEESVRENVRKTVEAFRTFHIPKAKRNNKPPILITLSLTLIALYVSLCSGVASPTIWSCYANFKSSLFISLEIDCFHGL